MEEVVVVVDAGGCAKFGGGVVAAVASRSPEHSDQFLCFFTHPSEQVRVPHRGHVYFGVEI